MSKLIKQVGDLQNFTGWIGGIKSTVSPTASDALMSGAKINAIKYFPAIQVKFFGNFLHGGFVVNVYGMLLMSTLNIDLFI